MTDQGEPAGLQPVPGTARGRGRIIVDLSDVVDRGTRRRAGVFRRALRHEVNRLRDPRRIADDPVSLVFAMILSGLVARGEAGRRGRPGVLGGRPDLARRRRSLPPDRARSCRTSTRRGCCRSSRRGRSCRGTSPGSSGAAARSSLLLWTIHWAYRRRPLTTAVIVAVLAFPIGANLDTGNINLQLTLHALGGPVHAVRGLAGCCGRSRPG